MTQEIETKAKVEDPQEIKEKPKKQIDIKKFLISFIVGVVVCLGMITFILLKILS